MTVQNSVLAFTLRSFLQVSFLALLGALAAPAMAATPEETARQVLAKSPIIDGHNDTPHQIAEVFDRDFSKFDLNVLPADVLAKTHTDIRAARAGFLGGQACPGSRSGWRHHASGFQRGERGCSRRIP